MEVNFVESNPGPVKTAHGGNGIAGGGVALAIGGAKAERIARYAARSECWSIPVIGA